MCCITMLQLAAQQLRQKYCSTKGLTRLHATLLCQQFIGMCRSRRNTVSNDKSVPIVILLQKMIGAKSACAQTDLKSFFSRCRTSETAV